MAYIQPRAGAYNQQDFDAAGQQHVVSQIYDPDAYHLWNNLKQCPNFNECKLEIYACIKAAPDVFTWYYYLRTAAKAKDFTDALHMSIRFVPPEQIWDAVVAIRKHPKYGSIRNLILSEMRKANENSNQSPSVIRQSDRSFNSHSHLSATTASSARVSELSTNTSYSTNSQSQHLNLAAKITDKILPELPLAPAKGSRMAPPGHCFVCCFRECKGKSVYKRRGDFTNHLSKEHPDFGPYDPSDYLRKDERQSITPIEVKAENADPFLTNAAPASPQGSYPDAHALSDTNTNDSNEDAIGKLDVDYNLIEPTNMTALSQTNFNSHPPHRRPFFGEITGISYHHPLPPQQQNSYFYSDDEMQAG